ncbi:MAG: GGDEF domain-containing protein [Spirochaetes bacterium]|nr:GGDEF domain-containing protein [Spirochaetota bacterium]MBU0955947.1 GGDEF domain-containing protein [Spirochaetota bacterium]
MLQSKKVLVLDLDDDLPDSLLDACTGQFSFLKLNPDSFVPDQLGGTLAPLIFINFPQIDPEGLRLCNQIRSALSGSTGYILIALPEKSLAVCEHVSTLHCDDFLLKPFSACQLIWRLNLALLNMEQVSSLRQEREFFRQAVMQEEQLSRKLLERQQLLKGSLVSSVRKNQELKTVHRRLQKQATYDVLTGLLNRRSLNDRLELEIAKSLSRHQSLCGLMIDIDYFKSVNDSFGHQAGDMVLSELGKLMHRYLRRHDHAGRYGGEEFFIVLPDSVLEDSLAIAGRIRTAIAETDLDWQGHTITVTVSIGLAEYSVKETMAQWINHIDVALYRAKDKGRNRICYFSDDQLLDYSSNPEATSAQR